MKKILLLFTCFFILTQKNFAKEIAFLNLEEVAKGSNSFKKVNESLEKKKQILENKFKKQEKDLTEKKNDLESKSSILSRESLQTKVMEFQKEVMKFQEEVKKEEEELQKELNNALFVLNDETIKIVQEMMKEKDFSSKYYSVASSVVFIYYKNENDITKEVLKRLNKKDLNLSKNSNTSKKGK